MMAKKYVLQSMMLSELLRDIVDVKTKQSCVVSGLALDSRDIKAGYVFIALRGENGHGIEFSKTAIENGAVAILNDASDDSPVIPLVAANNLVPVVTVKNLGEKLTLLATKFYGNASKNLTMIGITGTNGKTTCSQYIAQALHHNQDTAVIGTLGNGICSHLQPTRHTTPDNVSVHRLLNDFYVVGAMNVVMEVSSHGIDQGRIDNVNFNVAMFTNLTQDHLDYHGSMENYAATKRKLFESFHASTAVINIDDGYGENLLSSLSGQARKVSYSTKGIKSTYEFVCATGIVQNRQGMIISVDSSWGTTQMSTPLMGRFNASNLLGSLAVLLSLDFSLDSAVKQLTSFVALPGRMETIALQGQPLVVIDYAHTPDALLNVLQAVREHTSKQDAESVKSHGGNRPDIWCVFGCGGDRDKTKRAQMGRIAQQNADHIVLTDDNPRSESPKTIIDEICSGFSAKESHLVMHDRQQAIRHTIRQAKSTDIVIIAGKGHETYQVVGKEKKPYPTDLSIATSELRKIREQAGSGKDLS